MPLQHPAEMPCLLFANRQGEILDFPELQMSGRSARHICQPELTDLIPLPEGSELFVLPHRYPAGIDPADGQAALLKENPDNPADGIQAVAAFISPAHTSIHLTSYEKDESKPPPLPLFAYTAVGWYDNKFWVSAFRSDTSVRQDICRFNPQKIQKCTLKALEHNPDNRLIQHLGKCSLTYSCPAAKNYFLERDEAPLPCSPICNANCVGCISLQASGCCPSTQDRIKFIPTPREIAEIAVGHLQRVKGGVVSFGQGCEGEPLLQADTIESAIKIIRRQTDRGTINLNSNASLPQEVARLADAGLDSLRASINSARLDIHTKYYRPNGFDLQNVMQSIREMKKRGRFVSLNYFIFPGVTDCEAEFDALCRLLDSCGPDFIQLRNLNMDPDWYLDTIGHPADSDIGGIGRSMGITAWLAELKERYPQLGFGYFNPPLT